MTLLRHWHPVVSAASLGRKPVAVTLAGRPLALFRTASGEVGALDEECPHRRMKLSAGCVEGELLRCRYHGWTFDACGHGESPGTPKLRACAGSYETREAHGLVWVRERGSGSTFPEIDAPGYVPMCVLEHRAKAPLEVTLDNFCEIEHTPTTHAMFGYALDRMQEVNVHFEPTETAVRVVNSGPPKPIGLLLRLMLGVGKHYHFYDDWTTYFSPVYSVYEHWWADPATGRESWVRWRLYIFFVPVTDDETAVLTLVYAKSSWPGRYGCLRPFRGLMRRMVDEEIRLDVDILGNLASYDPSIEGMKLSRFDRVLGLNRERIERVYRGNEAGGLKMAG